MQESIMHKRPEYLKMYYCTLLNWLAALRRPS